MAAAAQNTALMAPHNLLRIIAEQRAAQADHDAMFALLAFLTGLGEGGFDELLETAGKALGGRSAEIADYFRERQWERGEVG